MRIKSAVLSNKDGVPIGVLVTFASEEASYNVRLTLPNVKELIDLLEQGEDYLETEEANARRVVGWPATFQPTPVNIEDRPGK